MSILTHQADGSRVSYRSTCGKTITCAFITYLKCILFLDSVTIFVNIKPVITGWMNLRMDQRSSLICTGRVRICVVRLELKSF